LNDVNQPHPKPHLVTISFHKQFFNTLDLNSIHLADGWIWAHFIYWPIFVLALYRAPWHILLQNDSSNILFATCAAVFFIWVLKVNVETGLSIHLLGSTILTLMFRWQVAVMANAIVVLGITLVTAADFQAYAMNTLITGILPIFISYSIWRINEWYLPPNYFAYIFIAAFLAAGVSMISSGLVSYQILNMLDNNLTSEMLDEYLMVFIPIMYPEAFITGAIISIFVIYKPEWISTFDDKRYLDKN
jgi:uncharacterized membrane protein